MAKTVLVINSGSSSIKYQLVDLESGEGLASGLVEKIGEPVDGHYKHEFNGEKHELEEPIHDHEQGLKRVLGFFDEFGPKLDEAGIVADGSMLGKEFSANVFNELYPAAIDPQIQRIAYKRYEQAYHLAKDVYGIEKMVVHSGYVPRIYYKQWHHEKSQEWLDKEGYLK